jgi:ABC-type Fe3+ transport system permease subunit
VTKVAVLVSLGSVLLALLLAWVTWNYVFSPVDRVFWAMLFGIGSVGGQ